MTVNDIPSINVPLCFRSPTSYLPRELLIHYALSGGSTGPIIILSLGGSSRRGYYSYNSR